MNTAIHKIIPAALIVSLILNVTPTLAAQVAPAPAACQSQQNVTSAPAVCQKFFGGLTRKPVKTSRPTQRF